MNRNYIYRHTRGNGGSKQASAYSVDEMMSLVLRPVVGLLVAVLAVLLIYIIV